MNAFEVARRSVDEYSETVESWQPDHDLAMACLAFEELLRAGIDSLSKIRSSHGEWQHAVMTCTAPPNLSVDQGIWDMYAWWNRPCRRVSRELRFFEKQGFEVKHADEFRAAWSELRSELRGLSRPVSPLRPVTRETVHPVASTIVDMSRYDD